jgi:glycogen synthase
MISDASHRHQPLILRRTKPCTDPVADGLRVLHATDSFSPNVGGLELAVADLAHAQALRGQTVAVATPVHPGAPDQEEHHNVEIHRLPMTMARLPGAYAEPGRFFFPPMPDPQFARAFSGLLKRFRPDVVHVHGWILYSVLGAARRAHVPVIATAHDLSQVCATKTMLYRDTTSCSGPALRKCVSCAFAHYGIKGIPLAAGLHQIGSRRHHHVTQWLAISSAVAAHGSAPRAADRSPMKVIPTYLDDDLLALASDARTAQRPSFVPATGSYLFYAGALGTHKGVNVLLQAYNQLCPSGADVALVLAGLPRPDFHIPDRPGIIVAPRVPLREVIAGFRHATVGVVPSVVEEGFGRVAVECLATGTPCVVSAIGGLMDIVTDGVDGLYVPPGDAAALAAALRQFLGDAQLRARLGAAGPAKAARFTLSRVLPQLDEVYQWALERKTGHAEPMLSSSR